MSNTRKNPGINNFKKTDTLLSEHQKRHPLHMKNADRPFLLIIFIAITLLYTIMAFIS